MKDCLEKAKNYALNLLSYRPRSENELTNRLQKSGYQADIITTVINFLKDYNYINDREFARQWIRNRMTSKPMGRKRLSWELRQKGIDRNIIDSVVGDIDETEENKMALKLVQEKYINKSKTYSSRQIALFLQRRGFSSDVIISICNNINSRIESKP